MLSSTDRGCVTGNFEGFFFCFWGAMAPQWARASSLSRFLDHTRRGPVGSTPLDEWSARRRDFYLTTHNTHNRQTSMPSVGFEPTISAGERPQTYALDRAATGTGKCTLVVIEISDRWKLLIQIGLRLHFNKENNDMRAMQSFTPVRYKQFSIYRVATVCVYFSNVTIYVFLSKQLVHWPSRWHEHLSPVA